MSYSGLWRSAIINITTWPRTSSNPLHQSCLWKNPEIQGTDFIRVRLLVSLESISADHSVWRR